MTDTGLSWMPAYGLSIGSVWPVPQTHGYLRLHQNAAREFSRSPVSGPRYTLPKLTLKTQPEAKTPRYKTQRPRSPCSILISLPAFKVDPTQ